MEGSPSEDAIAGGFTGVPRAHTHCRAGSTEGDVDVLLDDGKVAGIDPCISELVHVLNVGGVQTVASCCGHGKRPGSIALADGRELVIAESYEQARQIDAAFPDIHGKPIT